MLISSERRAERNLVTGLRRLWVRLQEHPLSRIGPGLITGVADDDPSGIPTYSQAGAQFGPNMLWTMSTDARGFYGVIAVSVLAGLGIQYSPINPTKALFWSAVNPKESSRCGSRRSPSCWYRNHPSWVPFTANRAIVVLGWIGTFFMGLALVLMFLPF